MAIVTLCAASLILYRQIALTNLVLPGADAVTYFYPYRAYAADAIRSGRIPLWNPYVFLGVPFLANPQTGVFYPPNLLLAWLTPAAAVGLARAPSLVAWSLALHAALAACGAYLYARRVLCLSPLPALLGASAFAFGGFLSGQAEHVNQLNVSAWFPLLLLLWEARHKARWPALLGLGGAIGMGLLAGHSQSSYITLAGLGVYAVLEAFLPQSCDDPWVTTKDESAGPGESRTRLEPSGRHFQNRHGGHGEEETRGGTQSLSGGTPPLGTIPQEHKSSEIPFLLRVLRAPVAPLLHSLWQLGFALLVGLGLAAVQLLPTLELSRLSIRSGGLSYREAVAFSLSPLPRLLRYTFLPA